MPSEFLFEIHEGLPRQGVGRNQYTRRAYEMDAAVSARNRLEGGFEVALRFPISG